MMVALKTGIIGVHFFCFRAINDVACAIEKGFKVGPICGELLKRELAAQGARCEDSLVAKLIPQAKAGLDLLSKLREGSEIARRACHDCHDPIVITASRLTAPQWSARVDAMLAKGAKVEDEEIDVLIDYLATHFGPNP